MAHYRQRTPGSWQILYYDPDGTKRSKTIKGTKRDAVRIGTEIERSVDQGTYVTPTRSTVEEVLWDWLDGHARERVGVTTYERYASVIKHRLAPTLGRVRVTELRPQQIQQLHADWRRDGLASSSIGLFHSVLRQALDLAVQLEVIPRNPSASITPPQRRRGARGILDDEQMRAFLRAAKDSRYYVPATIALTTGMRVGEICGLRWEDVDLDQRQLVVRRTAARLTGGEVIFKEPKTRASFRPITLPEVAVLALSSLPRDCDLVIHREGKPVTPAAISMGIKRLCRSLGLPTTVHGLRHTHASHLMREGEHPKVVSERLGHNSIGITLDIYSHVLPSQQRSLADRVDEAFRIDP